MKINDKIFRDNQSLINLFNADTMFEELGNYIDKYGLEYIFEKEFDTERKCLVNYCVRAHTIKLALDACEHYSKFILMSNNYSWDDMKSIGHNLFKAYSCLNDEDRKIINQTIFTSTFEETNTVSYNNSFKIYINDIMKSNKINDLSIENILMSFSSEKILPTIKSRYPGQFMIDYDEKFIIAYAHILYELCNKYRKDLYLNEENLNTYSNGPYGL